MSRDLTQKLNGSLEDKVDRLITVVQSMDLWGRSIDSRLENIQTRLGNLDTRLENVETRLGNLDTLVERVETRLVNLETKVDERLKDTRPMWEAVQAQLTEVESSLRAEIQRLRAEMEKDSRLFDRRMEGYFGEFGKLRAYQRDLEYRVDEIEKK